MTSTFRPLSTQPTRQYISLIPFNTNVYTYTVTFSVSQRQFVGELSLLDVTSGNAAALVILRDTGQRLIPGANSGVTSRMISVGFIGASDGLAYSGYIDPLIPGVFSLYTEDGPTTAEPIESDQYTSGVNTSGIIKSIGSLDISGTTDLSGTTRINTTGTGTTHIGNATSGVDISGNVTITGNTTASGRVYQQAGATPLVAYILVPVGCILPFTGASAPTGYLLCNGQAILRVTYADLFTTISTTFGVGDGSTTFNVPDMRGRMIIGQNGASFTTIGGTGGSESRTLTTTELPAHTHTGTTDISGAHSHSITDAGHTHTIQNSPVYGSGSLGTDTPAALDSTPGELNVADTEQIVVQSNTTGITIDSNGAHTHTFTTGSSGTGAAFSLMNPFFILTYIIKY